METIISDRLHKIFVENDKLLSLVAAKHWRNIKKHTVTRVVYFDTKCCYICCLSVDRAQYRYDVSIPSLYRPKDDLRSFALNTRQKR